MAYPDCYFKVGKWCLRDGKPCEYHHNLCRSANLSKKYDDIKEVDGNES